MLSKSDFLKTLNRVLLIVILVMFFYSCNFNSHDPVRVNFTMHEEESELNKEIYESKKLRIAFSVVLSPRESFEYYKELFEYLAEKLNMVLDIKQGNTYQQVNEMLERNEVDIAFICSGAYVEGDDSFDLLVAPLRNKRAYYQGLIISNKASGVKRFEDFKGKTFAYTDPMSNTGKLLVNGKLCSLGATEEDFFKSSIYTMSHDISIQMVARNMIDGAAVSGLVYEYIEAYQPDMLRNVAIVERSEDFGIPPVVSSLLISEQLRNELKDLFLNMHKDEIGKQVLKKLMVDRFVLVNDSIYNSVRELNDLNCSEP